VADTGVLDAMPFAASITLFVCLIAVAALCAAGAIVLLRGGRRDVRVQGIVLGIVSLGLFAFGVVVGASLLAA